MQKETKKVQSMLYNTFKKKNSSLPGYNKGAALRILSWCCSSILKEFKGLTLYVYFVEFYI